MSMPKVVYMDHSMKDGAKHRKSINGKMCLLISFDSLNKAIEHLTKNKIVRFHFPSNLVGAVYDFQDYTQSSGGSCWSREDLREMILCLQLGGSISYG